MIDRFRYGVCYYPEHWPLKVQDEDLARIKEAGFDFVRLGEGAWWYWEPEEGRYHFDLFDRVIDRCRALGLAVILGTPTYAAPAWVSHTYPSVLRWNFDRQLLKHGGRRQFNYTSPDYLRLSDNICTALAKHYAKEKQVFAWQLDNEFNCHSDASYAPADSAAFRIWLKAKYKTLEALNDAWGTQFWSALYDDWEQVDLPHPTVAYNNPSHLLDETRFISDTVVAFAQRQAAILRGANKHWQITHNGLFQNINGPDLAAQLDFFCHDQYPLFYKNWCAANYKLVEARSLSFPFGIMEQQAGPGGQSQYFLRTPRRGEQRLWAWQSVAHGAKLIAYFTWRTAPFGAEQRWHGLLDHDGKTNRRVEEAKLTGEELRKLPADFFNAKNEKNVAVLRDFDNETNDRRINTYNKSGHREFAHWQAAAQRRHFQADMVWPGDDFTGYQLLIAPHQKITDTALIKKITAYVTAGGTLILGAQAGVKDRALHMVRQTPPGPLRKLAGVEVEDFTTLPDDQTRHVALDDHSGIDLGTFVERLKLRGATPIGRWHCDDTLLNDAPAVTVNTVGAGRVIYIAGYAQPQAVGHLISRFSRELTLDALIDASEHVEFITRRGPKGRYAVLLNHSAAIEMVTLQFEAIDLLTDEPTWPRVKLEAYGVAVLRMNVGQTARGPIASR